MTKAADAHPLKLNMAVTSLLVLAYVYQLFILPLALVPRSPWWLLTLVPLAPFNLTLWYTIHESFHGGLHPSRKLNDALGRLLAVLFVAPFHVARFGHLTHHRFNRSVLDQPEVYDPAVIGRFRAVAVYYFRLFGGLYLGEMATFLVFLLPKRKVGPFIHWLLDRDEDAAKQIDAAAQHTLAAPKTVDAIRLDLAFTVLVLMSSMIVYGAYWYVPLALIGVRAAMISPTDNLPHYGTPLSRPEFAYNLYLPRWAALALLNFNHHRVHHGRPTLPWTHLPKALAEQRESFDLGWVRAGLNQLRGPILQERL